MKIIGMTRLIRGLCVFVIMPCLTVVLTFGALPVSSSISLAGEASGEKVYLTVQGVATDADVEAIKSALAQMPGIKSCKIDPKRGVVELTVTEDADLEAVVDAIEGGGYTVVNIMYEEGDGEDYE